ncbi:MAG: hypothetical protein WKG07_09215 [Hymenobacter sp.]
MPWAPITLQHVLAAPASTPTQAQEQRHCAGQRGSRRSCWRARATPRQLEFISAKDFDQVEVVPGSVLSVGNQPRRVLRPWHRPEPGNAGAMGSHRYLGPLDDAPARNSATGCTGKIASPRQRSGAAARSQLRDFGSLLTVGCNPQAASGADGHRPRHLPGRLRDWPGQHLAVKRSMAGRPYAAHLPEWGASGNGLRRLAAGPGACCPDSKSLVSF